MPPCIAPRTERVVVPFEADPKISLFLLGKLKVGGQNRNIGLLRGVQVSLSPKTQAGWAMKLLKKWNDLQDVKMVGFC